MLIPTRRNEMSTSLVIWFPWLRLLGNGESEKIDCSASSGQSSIIIIRFMNEQDRWLVQLMSYDSYFISNNTDKILQKVA